MTINIFIPGNVVTIFRTEFKEGTKLKEHNTYQGVWEEGNDIVQKAIEFNVLELIRAARKLPVTRVTLEV